MKQPILNRVVRDGATVRVLACGHEQREYEGSEAPHVVEAICVQCGPAPRHEKPAPKSKPERPVDTRTELQRHADAVEAAYLFPIHAWGARDVAIRKLLDAVRKHSCAVATTEGGAA